MIDHNLLDLILEPGGITIVFQPVIAATENKNCLHSLECLTRGPFGTNISDPEILFEYVRRKREEHLVDLTCLEMAFKTVAKLPGEHVLSVNVHARSLGTDPDFAEIMKKFATASEINFDKLIFEIIESGAILDNRILLDNLVILRRAGAKIALDDFGARHSNYDVMLQINPEFLKIDKKIVRGCHADVKRQIILASLVEMSEKIGAALIAKGVEEEAEFCVLKNLQINLMQGFLFSPPVSGEVLMTTDLLTDCLI